MTEAQSVAAMKLALDALEDKDAPPLLALAAWRYVYRGEAEFFVGLCREAYEGLASVEAAAGEETR